MFRGETNAAGFGHLDQPFPTKDASAEKFGTSVQVVARAFAKHALLLPLDLGEFLDADLRVLSSSDVGDGLLKPPPRCS
jgi:hypothetical protein